MASCFFAEAMYSATPNSTSNTMAIGAGGLIKQTIVKDDIPADQWDLDNTVFFNLQFVNAAAFPLLTGLPAPPTPVSAATYASHGYPFYQLYEEPTGIKGNFKGLKSVGELDREKGVNHEVHEKEKDLSFPFAMIGKKPSFVPVSEMEKQMSGLRIINDL